MRQQCIALDRGSSRGSKRKCVQSEKLANQVLSLDATDVVMYHWHRWKNTHLEGVFAEQTLLEF